MTQRHATHPDYRRIPSFKFRFGSFLIWMLNLVTRCERRLRCGTPRPGVLRERLSIPGDAQHAIAAILSKPEQLAGSAPIVLYYHGGAFAFTYGTMHLQFCERYALEAGCIVILVDYRLGPAHRFPHGFNDCYDALTWAKANAAALGGDPQRIAVMGDSAGGAMAAGVAQKAADNGIALRAQLLIYPVLDSECKTYSATEFHDVPLFNAFSNQQMWSFYLRDFPAGPPPYAAPGLRKNLAGLAPALIETAEFDPLRDEGLQYAADLAAEEVPVVLNQTRGTVHGFELASRNPETIRSLSGRIAFLKARLA